MRTHTILLILCLFLLIPAHLEAQASRTAAQVTAAQLVTVGDAIDTVPRTVSALVTKTGLPEATVRTAASRLLAAKTVRYRLLPVASGDTTASGRPRRERAYYRVTTP